MIADLLPYTEMKDSGRRCSKMTRNIDRTYEAPEAEGPAENP